MQDHLDDQLVNVNFPRLVLLYLLAAKDGDKTGIYGLGRPKVDGDKNSGILVTAAEHEKARKASIFGSLTFQPIIQYKNLPDNTTVITSLHGNNPQVDNWQDNTYPTTLYRPTFRWVTYSTPYSISVDELRFTRRAAGGNSTEGGWEAVGSLITAETTHRLNQHCQKLDGDWHTGTGPSNTDADYWDGAFGIQYSLATDNTYGGVDRTISANSWWQGNYITASTPAVFRDLSYYANLSTSGPQLAKYGLAIDTYLVGGDLFIKALEEAEARGARVVVNKLPSMGEFGIESSMVKIDDRFWVIHDPGMPANHVAGLNLATWLVAFHPEATFNISEPEDGRRLPGGPRQLYGTIETQVLGPVCLWPKANIYWTNVS